jgi:hypothetical protein
VITTIPDAALSTRPAQLKSWSPDLGPLDRTPRTSLDPGTSPQLEASGGPLPRGPGAVQATIYGTHAEVVVRQQFRNDRPVRIDGVYALRLPEQAVPLGYRITVNDRVFESQVVDAPELRERCPAMYSASFDVRPPAGPWIRQHVPELPAGAVIETELRYLQRLAYSGGAVEFAAPVVSAPDQPLALEVEAVALGAIHTWAAPGHDEVAADIDGSALGLRHSFNGARDEVFVLRYRSAIDRPQGAVFVTPPDSSGLGTVVVEVEPPAVAVRPREFVFVLGGGFSERQALVLNQLLAHVRPDDTIDLFDVLPRATKRLANAPLPATRATLDRAATWLQGGVADSPAASLTAALAAQPPPDFDRVVFLFVDRSGRVAAKDTLARIRDVRAVSPRTRVFTVETRASQLDAAERRAAALVGASAPIVLSDSTALEAAMRRVAAYLDPVVLDALAVDWDNPSVRPLRPGATLGAGEPLRIVRRYRGAPPRTIELRGRAGHDPFALSLATHPLPAEEAGLAALPKLETIDSLLLAGDLAMTTDSYRRDADATPQELRAFGVAHQLVTPFTPLVLKEPGSARATGDVDPALCTQVLAADRAWRPYYMPTLCGGPFYIPPPRLRESMVIADVSPRAVEDARGVALAGTPSAESTVLVDGVPTNDALTTVTPDEGAGGPPKVEPIEVPTTARIRVRRRRRASSADRRLRDHLHTERDALVECFLAAPRASYRIRQRLEIRARWSPERGLEDFTIAAAKEIPQVITTCLRNHVDDAASTSLKDADAGDVVLTLDVGMTF